MEELLAEKALASRKIGKFVDHYLSAIVFAALPVAFWLLAVVVSYVSYGSLATLWMLYLFIGLGRVFWPGNGIPAPNRAFVNDKYIETYHTFNSLTGNIDVERREVPGKIDLDNAITNLGLHFALQAALVLFLVALWGPMDLVLQGAHLLIAGREFRRSGRVSEYRTFPWSSAGCAIVPVVVLVGWGAVYSLNAVVGGPPERSAADLQTLDSLIQPGRVYHGLWKDHPEASKLGVRIDTVATSIRDGSREFTATIFDANHLESSRQYRGQVNYRIGVMPVLLWPLKRGDQALLGFDLKDVFNEKKSVNLWFQLRRDGILYMSDRGLMLELQPSS
jgi:hypothetical protein